MVLIKLSILLITFLYLGQSQGKDVHVTHEVTFGIKLGDDDVKNVIIALFGKTVPKTVRNFKALAEPEGYYGYTYLGTKFHRVIPQFVIQVCIIFT